MSNSHIVYTNHMQGSAVQPVSSEQKSLLMDPQQYQPMLSEYNLASVPESASHRGNVWSRAKKHLHMNGDGVYKATLVTLIIYVVFSFFSLWSMLSVPAFLNIAVAIYGGVAVKHRKTSRVGIFSGILVFKMLSDPVSFMLVVFNAISNHKYSSMSRLSLYSTGVFVLAYCAQTALLIFTCIHLNREYQRDQSKEASQTFRSEAATFIQVNEVDSDEMAVQQ